MSTTSPSIGVTRKNQNDYFHNLPIYDHGAYHLSLCLRTSIERDVRSL